MTKVLVVEDDPGILRTLADNLRFEQYEVVTATDGETAFTTLTSCCCSEVASPADASGATGVTSLLGPPAPHAATTAAPAASAAVIRCLVIVDC